MIQYLKTFFGLLTPSSSRRASPSPEDVNYGRTQKLFPKTNPAIDGEDCLHDCENCTIKYSSKFSIDEEDQLFGQVNGWDTHLIVSTGKDNWVHDVADEKGSIMEAIGKGDTKPTNGVSFKSCPYTHQISNGSLCASENDALSIKHTACRRSSHYR